MGKVPAVKRRKLTPPPTDGEESAVSTLEPEPKSNAFFKQASSWNLEQDYETRPRKGKKKEKESTRLPIKTAEGLVQQVEEPKEAQDEESDLEWLGAEDGEEGEEEVVEEVREPTIPVLQQILEAKEELARIALLLNEDPEENSAAFKTLAQFSQSPNTTIKKLALATQLAVYRDVIPGYRIRPLSEEDMEIKVSKEVRKLRAYEQGLVGGYQAYIRELSKLAQSGRGTTKNTGPSLSSIAINCACTLLTSVPHFNFRGELLKILVGKLSTRKVDDDFNKCRETIETLFHDDEDGTPSLDAVALLTKMMKGRGYRVDESVLNTFLHLRLLSEFSWKASTNHVDKPDKEKDVSETTKVKGKRVFRTKKERKILKERKVVEKEMVQADASVSHEERDRMQAETLKLVFVTYFRILKARSPNLMGAVLEGLARYAHLINQDFFGDLLEALKDLIGHAETGDDVEENEIEGENDAEMTRNLTREALLCVITAFALLEGQDAHKAKASLHLDLSFFITHLYRNLYALSLNPDLELSAKSLHLPDPSDPNPPALTATNNKINIQTTTVLLLRSLSSVLLPPLAQRAVPPLRIAAFTKQLLTSSLHLPEKSCMAVIGLLGKVTKTHEKKIAALWNTEERRGDGTFDPLSGEVEGSNPFATTIWEGEILKKHYCPAVRDGVKTIEKNVLGLR
jgi:nucleolar complex protein 3